MRDLAYALQEQSLHPSQSCVASVIKPWWLSKPNALASHLLVLDPRLGSLTWSSEPTPMGEPLKYTYSPVCCPHHGLYDLLYLKSTPLTPSFWFLHYVSSCRRSFPVVSGLSHWWLFCRYLWFWCAHERRWVQGFSTHSFWLFFKWKF